MSETKIRTFKGFWTVSDVRNLSDSLFIYGDNNAKMGKRGQAIIRYLPNTVGIPTKKYPSNKLNAFYSDKDYEENVGNIKKFIDEIIKKSHLYKYIVFPENGLGTGLAKLPLKAPKTYKYLVEAVNKLKEIIREKC